MSRYEIPDDEIPVLTLPLEERLPKGCRQVDGDIYEMRAIPIDVSITHAEGTSYTILFDNRAYAAFNGYKENQEVTLDIMLIRDAIRLKTPIGVRGTLEETNALKSTCVGINAEEYI